MFDLYRSALEKNLSRETEEAKTRPILPQNLRFSPLSVPCRMGHLSTSQGGLKCHFLPHSHSLPLPLSFFAVRQNFPHLKRKPRRRQEIFSPFAVGLLLLLVALSSSSSSVRGIAQEEEGIPRLLSRSGGKRDGWGRRKRRRWLLGKKDSRKMENGFFLSLSLSTALIFPRKEKKHFRARCSFNRFPFRNSLFLDSLKWKKSLV